MKLEAGKYYRTRSGAKAYVVAILTNPFTNCPHGAVGYMQGNIHTQYWSDASGDSMGPHWHPSANLEAEWKEPVVHKRYVAWIRGYQDAPRVEVFACPDIARQVLGDRLLKIEELTYTEDQ